MFIYQCSCRLHLLHDLVLMYWDIFNFKTMRKAFFFMNVWWGELLFSWERQITKQLGKTQFNYWLLTEIDDDLHLNILGQLGDQYVLSLKNPIKYHIYCLLSWRTKLFASQSTKLIHFFSGLQSSCFVFCYMWK